MAKKIEFDYSKILGLIKEYGLTQQKISKKIGISNNTLNSKLNGKGYFTAIEIYKLMTLLNCDYEYFFIQKVKK